MGAHPVALAVDVEHDTAVQPAVEHGGGHHRVVEDLPPRADAEIGRHDDGALEVALGYDLEERSSGLALEGQVAHLVDDQKSRTGEETHGGGPSPFEGGPVTAGGQVGGRRVV